MQAIWKIQMVHGGTNFGFYNGANTGEDESDYKPDLTSYDYVSSFMQQFPVYIFILCLMHCTCLPGRTNQ